ncbi:MAG: thiamine pyrophosphate-dependent enzyme [Planctomycetes bacterium]|nr:thiamine pyrophosphate-dependent enzyme [Planctomycetota bacterium]
MAKQASPARNAAKAAPAKASALPPDLKKRLLELMLHARANDEAEITLKRRGQGHFHMSSSGHEGLAGVALAMDENDWLHPHYRDRAIVLGRGITHEQIFLDYFAKRDSATGGRQMPVHFNSRRQRIVSLSSPVGTNMLQAAGMAMSLRERKVPEAVVASIGDASTREGETFETIAQAASDKLPLLLLVEDNRYGISTSTVGKTFWTTKNSIVTAADGTQWFMGVRFVEVDGLDPEAVYHASREALQRAKAGEGATILVAEVERMGSHSSSDDQRIYRTEEELEAIKAKDPVKRYSAQLIAEKVVTEKDIAAIEAKAKSEIEAAIAAARAAPDPDPARVRNSAFAPLPEDLPRQEQGLPAHLAKRSGGLTMAQCIARVLDQEMVRNPRMYLFGEDIEDPKGDVFSTTKGLSTKYGDRVRNSPLAEATILGSAVGRAVLGDLPVPCIQFVDFMGPALNQLFNEVITFYWRSMGQWNCPMVIMAPYGGYLPGLGPWHSQTNEAIYAHMPGLHVAIPSNPGDAAGLLRFALRCNRPVLYLYPKALLHGAEDTVKEPGVDCVVPFGLARIVRPGRDVTLATWGNCVAICRQAAQRAAQEGIEAEIVDLRTVAPYDLQAVLDSVARTGRLVVVHEDAKTCGLGGDIVTEVVAHAWERLQAIPARVTKPDEHNPYQFALELSLLPSVEDVLNAVRDQHTQRLRPGTVTSAAPSRAAAPAVSASATVAPVAGFAPVPELRATGPARSSAAAPSVAKAAGPTRVPVVVPKQSPTDEDATVVQIKVKVGDKVQPGTMLAEMEANKGSFDLESTNEGTIVEIHAREGERVRVDTPIMYIEVPEGAVVHHADETRGEPAGGPALKEFRLTPAQIQVGALALKSQREIPTVNVETEVDVTPLFEQRAALKDELSKKHRIHVTYTHLILWAMVQTMMKDRHEGFRGVLDPNAERLMVEPHANIGFAALGPHEDLYTPVIREADRLSFIDLVKRAQELTESVRTGSMNAADLQGATITLTNIGAFEATGGTPFVIPGQVAMVCASSLIDRPRYIQTNGSSTLEHRKALPLKLVFDHRPFNGSHAAGFLRALKHQLEEMDLKKLIG